MEVRWMADSAFKALAAQGKTDDELASANEEATGDRPTRMEAREHAAELGFPVERRLASGDNA